VFLKLRTSKNSVFEDLHIPLPVKILDYILRSNKSNINQPRKFATNRKSRNGLLSQSPTCWSSPHTPHTSWHTWCIHLSNIWLPERKFVKSSTLLRLKPKNLKSMKPQKMWCKIPGNTPFDALRHLKKKITSAVLADDQAHNCSLFLFPESLRETPSLRVRSLEDETGNCERNANRNPEWWGDFSQLVKIETINFSVSHGTKSNWDFDWIWILWYLAVQIQIEIFVWLEFAVD